MLNKDIDNKTLEFLGLVANVAYPKNQYVRNAIGSLIQNPDTDIIEARTDIICSLLDKWEGDDKTVPAPEEIISCLVGVDIKKFGHQKFIELFGKEAYQTTKILSSIPNGRNKEKTKDFLKNSSKRIKHISFIMAIENLTEIFKTVDNYNYCKDEICAHINLGLLCKTDENPRLNKVFDGFAFHFYGSMFQIYPEYAENLLNNKKNPLSLH